MQYESVIARLCSHFLFLLVLMDDGYKINNKRDYLGLFSDSLLIPIQNVTPRFFPSLFVSNFADFTVKDSPTLAASTPTTKNIYISSTTAEY